jgi:hypothetical protein
MVAAAYPGANFVRGTSTRTWAVRYNNIKAARTIKKDGVFVYAPLYDPKRDDGPVYASPQPEFLGDPPIGRREMLAKHEPDRVVFPAFDERLRL